MISVRSEVIVEELKAATTILSSWVESIEKGIPGVDLPGDQEALEAFMRHLCGELLIVSGKTETLSNVLSGEL